MSKLVPPHGSNVLKPLALSANDALQEKKEV